MTDKLREILEILGYWGAPGLLMTDDPRTTTDLGPLVRQAKKVLGIDAVYLVETAPTLPRVPIIYFKQFESPDPDEFLRLHTRVWNQGRVPLLVLVLPTEVRVYNAFAKPGQNPDEMDAQALLDAVSMLATAEEIRQQFEPFSRPEIESGRFWEKATERFGAAKGDFQRHRVDRDLLSNLRIVREKLGTLGLSYEHIHSLLTRSILMLFLEHRRVLTTDFYSRFDPSAKGYLDVLRSKDATFRLFEAVHAKLNGDILPVSEEEAQAVTVEHLTTLREFLLGTHMGTGQRTFFPYDFSVIPVELISNIYEEFYHLKGGGEGVKDGTHYTPAFLVDMTLNEVLPWNYQGTRVRVLDPACGSGIFLVEAYRRIIENSRRATGVGQLEPAELQSLLQECIFGVDTNPEAIRIAAFSLYLTMLDHVEPPEIWHKVRFPKLRGRNLFIQDFFDTSEAFNALEFDVVVGNPPWKSGLSEQAANLCSARGWPIGDKQIAQAFLWRASEIVRLGGTVGLIVGATSLLFNRNPKNRQFRAAFFSSYHVRTVVNLALVRHELFETAIGPGALVVYTNCKPALRRPITYVVPKSTPEARSLGKVLIEPLDISRIGRQHLDEHGLLWKVAMFGTFRDLALVKRLYSTYPSLKSLFQGRSRRPREGFIKGTNPERQKDVRPELGQMPYVDSRDLLRPQSTWALKPTGIERYERGREPDTYKAPMVLLKHSPHKGRFFAAVVTQDVVFGKSLFSIPGDIQDLPWLRFLAAFYRSKLAAYLVFHTSSRWGIERSKVDKADLENLPVLPPNAIPSIFYLEGAELDSQAAENAIYQAFGLTQSEIQLVEDTTSIIIDFFERGTNSRATSKVTPDALREYALAFSETLAPFLTPRGKGLATRVVSGNAPLQVVSFTIVDGDSTIAQVEQLPDLESELRRLERVLKQELPTGLSLRRNAKVYHNQTLYILKPNELRHWTRSIGMADADETIAELLSGGAD